MTKEIYELGGKKKGDRHIIKNYNLVSTAGL